MEKHRILFRKGLLIIGLPVFIAILLRLYCFDTYKILSTSMTPTLIPGDLILVSKMSYGPRMLKVRQFFKDGKNEYLRLKGFGTIKRGDLVVFNWPNYASLKDSNQTMFGIVVVKRCYGIPGDTVMIRDDGSTLESASKQQQQDEFFPHDSTFKWTISNYGPLFVPGKGFSIKLTDRNIRIYKDVFAYERIKFFRKGDSVFLNKRYVTNYTFKSNYYFMKGDNFYGSMDSRYWGFVPENNVIGKTIMVLFSNGEDGFQWKRLFHLIK